MDNLPARPQVPSPAERSAMTQSSPGSSLGELGLARANARELIRCRFPGFVFRLKARTSSNGDVSTLKVEWPAVPGAPDKEQVRAALDVFWSFAKEVDPAEDGMGLSMFQNMYGRVDVLAVAPRTPKPEDLAVSLHRRLKSGTPVARGPRM